VATGGPFPSDSNAEPDRAVVLLGPDAEAPDGFDGVLDASRTLFEVVRHPLLAAAELVRLERDVRQSGSASRTTLWVVDRDIADLGDLFQMMRTSLPRVPARILVQGERLTVIEGASDAAKPSDGAARSGPAPAPSPDRRPLRLRHADDRFNPTAASPGPTATEPPANRADATGDPREEREEHEEDPPGPSGSAPTPEEIEMLLSMFDDEPPHEPEPRP
jgi:hypothetical protein